MNMRKRILDLMDRVEPDRVPAMTAVFDDGRREPVPPDIAPCVFAMDHGMKPEGSRIIAFESEEDPVQAARETEFAYLILGETGDRHHLWDEERELLL